MTKAGPRDPFVGPRPFERGDFDIFFGRGREVRELLSLVVAHRVVVLYAVSGAGKTSLLNAGLVPALEGEEGFEVMPVGRLRGLQPDGSLSAVPQNVYMFNALSNWSETTTEAAQLGTRLVGLPRTRPAPQVRSPGHGAKDHASRPITQLTLAEFLGQRPHPDGDQGFPAPRAVIFDQFEELFSLYPEYWRHRAPFLDQVAEALRQDPLLRVILSMREEYLAELDRYRTRLPRGTTARFRLERLGAVGALSAVTSPLEGTGRSFTPSAAEALVNDLLRFRIDTGTGETVEVDGEFVEPVQLQVVCRSLWNELPPEVTVINESHLSKIADVDQVLSRFYSDAIAAAAAKSGVAERELRVWFERQFITAGGTRNTLYHTRLRTAGMPNEVIDELEARHLIRAEWRAGARWYELTHDRFIGPIKASNGGYLYGEVGDDPERTARLRASQALSRAEAAWLESLFDEVHSNQEEAIQIYESLGDRSAVANTLMRMAELDFRSEEFARARELAQQAREIYAELDDELGVADGLRAIGRVEVREGRPDEGVPLLEEALDIYVAHGQDVGAGWTLVILSEALQAQHHPDVALDLARRARELFTLRGERAGAAASFASLGSLSVELGQLREALEFYDNAKQIDWELADLVSAAAMLAQMAYIHCDQEAYNQAASRFTEAIRLAPDDLSLYSARAAAYFHGERHAEAIDDYSRVLERLPDDVEAHNGRGRAYAELSQFDHALGDADQALMLAQTDQQRACAKTVRGLALDGLGRYDEALEELATALELARDNGFAYYYRALVLERMRRHDDARADLQRALDAQDPRLSLPRRARAQALLGPGNPT